MNTNQSDDLLAKLNKNQLIQIVKDLQTENVTLTKERAELLDFKKFTEETNRRITELEREHYKTAQYYRRDTVEISGIPSSVKQDDLEDEVIRIYEAAGVRVDGQALDKLQIAACHFIGKKKNKTIVKFVNRKFANEGLYGSKNLKGKQLYEGSPVYINNNFCNQYAYINFLVRKAAKNKKVFRYKVKHGITMIKIKESDNDFREVTHKMDLVHYGIYTADEVEE